MNKFKENFSSRLIHLLENNEIHDLDDLRNLTPKEILSWRNSGKKCLNEIRFFLIDKGFSLKNDIYNPEFMEKISTGMLKKLCILERITSGICNRIMNLTEDLQKLKKITENLREEIEECNGRKNKSLPFQIDNKDIEKNNPMQWATNKLYEDFEKSKVKK